MNKKYKYIVFSPYFGELPSNFDLWLKSCSYNEEIKFIVFTNNCIKNVLPNNVQVFEMSFKKFIFKLQQKFDFPLEINNPYKLCDCKPIYGYVFNDLIKDCEYWGHCDMDIIFGDLSKYMPNGMYDKISFLGHFCLYRNNNKINKMFMNAPDNTISYKDILSNKQHFGFDEIGKYGINNIFLENNLSIYNYEKNVADIDCRRKQLYVIKYINQKFYKEKIKKIFFFDNKKIYSIYYNRKKQRIIEEYAYIHLQKRKMINKVKDSHFFYIFSNCFENCNEEFTQTLFKEKTKNNKFINFNWFNLKKNAIKNRWKRRKIIQAILKKRVTN